MLVISYSFIIVYVRHAYVYWIIFNVYFSFKFYFIKNIQCKEEYWENLHKNVGYNIHHAGNLQNKYCFGFGL